MHCSVCGELETTRREEAPTQAPVLTAGIDGTNVRTLLTDTSGRPVVTTQAAVGAAAGNPFPVGSRDDSNNVLATHSCPDQAAFNVSAGTDVTIVSGAMGKTTYICHVDFAAGTSSNMTIRQGTLVTTPCDTSTAALSGAYQGVVSFADDYNSLAPLHTTSTGVDVCLHFSGSVTAGGYVTYAQY